MEMNLKLDHVVHRNDTEWGQSVWVNYIPERGGGTLRLLDSGGFAADMPRLQVFIAPSDRNKPDEEILNGMPQKGTADMQRVKWTGVRDGKQISGERWSALPESVKLDGWEETVQIEQVYETVDALRGITADVPADPPPAE